LHDFSCATRITPRKVCTSVLPEQWRLCMAVGYAFLSFYKILETAFPRDDKRIAWITASIAGLSGFGVKEALDSIRAQGITAPEDIGTHLFKSGRCAMAHGARKPIVDPDNPGDLRRLGSELPIVRALATKAIKEVFGIETRSTNFCKHLYEKAHAGVLAARARKVCGAQMFWNQAKSARLFKRAAVVRIFLVTFYCL
jgi:hypothetical protein